MRATTFAGEMKGLQSNLTGTLATLKSKLGQVPREVLRKYLLELRPSGSHTLADLETQTTATIRKLNKSMKNTKKKLGKLVVESQEQIETRTRPQHSWFRSSWLSFKVKCDDFLLTLCHCAFTMQ